MEAKINRAIFNKESYGKHADWYNKHFPDKTDKFNFYLSQKRAGESTIATWLQSCFFNCLTPLLEGGKSNWLTVGDAYGFDAQHLLSKGMDACASDLNSDFLGVANEMGIVGEYATQNAECLSYADESFDFLLCKESYHHFPRPYAALYEMIRVAKKAIVIIEPHDPITKMPLLMFLFNITHFWPYLQGRLWKNRFSFEPVGNFVYKISEREFEKFAAGMNLPAVAFKYFNPNFYHPHNELKKASFSEPAFLILRLKKLVLDTFMRLKLVPGQVLSAIIFKEMPDAALVKQLKKEGYRVQFIPKNPYL